MNDGEHNGTERLGELLRGIERTGELEEALEERGQRAQARLGAYNSALLFAACARRTASPVISTFSGSLSAAQTSAPIDITPTWVGINAFVDVHLRNNTPVVLGLGWNLRLSLEHVNESVCTSTVFMPLPTLDVNGTTVVSFPLVLQSHAPITATLQMQFFEANRHCTSPSRRLSHTIARNVVLDILTFSAPVKMNSSNQAAHQNLPASRLQQAVSNITQEEALPTSCHLLLPVSNETIRVLSGRRRSLLGSNFSVQVTDEEAILRAAPMVLPFLRAAVLRRCSSALKRVTASSRESREQWERLIADSVDACSQLMGEAEAAINDAKLVRNSGLEGYSRKQDEAAIRQALNALEIATNKWRSKSRQVWKPEDAQYS